METAAAAHPVQQQTRLLRRLDEARARTDAVFNLVAPAAFYQRPIPERHRLIFYLGHLEAFDWNILGRGLLGLDSFRPEFDRLFAFGIDPVDGKLPCDQPADWPIVEEIRRYNAGLRQRIDKRLRAMNWSESGVPELQDGLVVNVIIEHRLMHAETLAYLLHQLPSEQIRVAAARDTFHAPSPLPKMVRVPAGLATLGLPRGDGTEFGWDNEFAQHQVSVPEFAVSDYPVTNGQFLEFVQAGGYQQRSLWTEEAWHWISQREITHPYFWTKRNGGWGCRTMNAEVPLPAAWPAYVSHSEASAYAEWKEKRLPTEAQWHRAAYGSPQETERRYPWGDAAPTPAHGNFNFRRWDPSPVDAHPAGASGFGVFDLLGNGWEWTRTQFAPFPGFERFPFYPGYSENFFDGKHFVMKGGSPQTAACMLRPSFRNWFQPHYPYVYGTFRLVED